MPNPDAMREPCFGSEGPALLGVEFSVSDRRWEGPSIGMDRYAQALQQRYELPVELARCLARRGVEPPQVSIYLDPRVRDLFGNPMAIADMPAAARRLARAVSQLERVALIASGTTDGLCALAVLALWLEDAGCQTQWQVLPAGLAAAQSALKRRVRRLDGSDLIVCLDCGANSVIDGNWAPSSDVVVLDSCICLNLPVGVQAYVNPNRFDEPPEHAHLCTAGVAYTLVAATRSALKRQATVPPRAIDLLGLVALATCSSDVPMIGVNRAFVRQGMSRLRARQHEGLRAMADLVLPAQAVRAEHLKSSFSPVLLAGECVGDVSIGAQLLVARGSSEAERTVESLKRIRNESLPELDRVSEEAVLLAEGRGFNRALVWASGKNWPRFALSHAASVLGMRSGRPSVTVSVEGNVAHAVGRSVAGIDLGTVVEHCALQGWISVCTTHRMTVEMEIPVKHVTRVFEQMEMLLRRQGAHLRDRHAIFLDGMVSLRAVSTDLVDSLDRLGPFGIGSPRPRYVLPWIRVKGRKLLSGRHLALTMTDEDGCNVKGFMPDAVNGPVGKFLLSCRGRVHIAGTLRIYDRRGTRRPTVYVEDASPVG
ncbi:MAG: hypothetical protein OXB95_07785 [Rhodobacteraceae bacterium]|nr:hypothetical protein [Paracoccaceae bacterium]